jgi:hypothetical protein
VRVTSYDQTLFTIQDPAGRASSFRFSGGRVENGARFSVSWTPSGATIESYEWVTEPDLSGPIEVGAVWDQRRVDRINRLTDELGSIPVHGRKDYSFASQHEVGMAAEDVLGALSDLAILTLGVESYTATVRDPVTGLEETILGGEFGQLVAKTLLAHHPKSKLILVYNLGNTNPQGGVGNEIYFYEVHLPTGEYITVQLSPRYARAGSGCDLGVYDICNQKDTDTESTPMRMRVYELLFEHPNPQYFPEMDPASWIASFFHYRSLADAKDTILEIEGWLFAEGNPDWIRYRPMGPP